jgi:hypothetical protein
MDALRVHPQALLEKLNAALAERFGVDRLVRTSLLPEVYLDYDAIERRGLARADVENAAARYLLAQPGIAQVYTRTQLEQGVAAQSRLGTLMQRAWNRTLSGDLLVVTTPYTIFSSGTSGASHGTPWQYDTSVPLLMMGRRWIRPGGQAGYAEVVDIAPTLAEILHVRRPAGAEGRVLTEVLR